MREDFFQCHSLQFIGIPCDGLHPTYSITNHKDPSQLILTGPTRCVYYQVYRKHYHGQASGQRSHRHYRKAKRKTLRENSSDPRKSSSKAWIYVPERASSALNKEHHLDTGSNIDIGEDSFDSFALVFTTTYCISARTNWNSSHQDLMWPPRESRRWEPKTWTIWQ